MERIAILFTGRIIIHREQYKNFKRMFLKENFKVDIFVSHSPVEKEIRDQFIQLYHPIKIKESDEKVYQDGIEKYPKNIGTNYKNAMCMFLNRKYVFELLDEYIKETNIVYDLIISSRTDLWFSKKMDFNFLLEKTRQNILCIPNPKFDYTGINDQIAIGNYDTMNIYLHLYDHLISLLEKGILFHPETLLKHYLENVKIERFKLRYHIKRY